MAAPCVNALLVKAKSGAGPLCGRGVGAPDTHALIKATNATDANMTRHIFQRGCKREAKISQMPLNKTNVAPYIVYPPTEKPERMLRADRAIPKNKMLTPVSRLSNFIAPERIA